LKSPSTGMTSRC